MIVNCIPTDYTIKNHLNRRTERLMKDIELLEEALNMADGNERVELHTRKTTANVIRIIERGTKNQDRHVYFRIARSLSKTNYQRILKLSHQFDGIHRVLVGKVTQWD